MFDVKPHVDATHDQLVHMVTELIFQNEYLKSQSEGLQVFHSESDGLSLFRSKVSLPRKNIRETAVARFVGNNIYTDQIKLGNYENKGA